MINNIINIQIYFVIMDMEIQEISDRCINDPTSDCAEVLRFEDNIHDIGCGVNCNHAKLDFILSLINKWILALLIIWLILISYFTYRKYKWKKWLWWRLILWNLIFCVIIFCVWFVVNAIFRQPELKTTQ